MYELEPGNRLWPYHTHHANEEWLVVVRGGPTPADAGGRARPAGRATWLRSRAGGGRAPGQQPDGRADPRAHAVDPDHARPRRVPGQREGRGAERRRASESSPSRPGRSSTTGTARTEAPRDPVARPHHASRVSGPPACSLAAEFVEPFPRAGVPAGSSSGGRAPRGLALRACSADHRGRVRCSRPDQGRRTSGSSPLRARPADASHPHAGGIWADRIAAEPP